METLNKVWNAIKGSLEFLAFIISLPCLLYVIDKIEKEEEEEEARYKI